MRVLVLLTTNNGFDTDDPSYKIYLVTVLFLLLIWCVYTIYVFVSWFVVNYPRFLRKRYHPALQYSSFYKNLSPKEKLRFEKRVQLFINTRKFISRGSFSIGSIEKARIATAAVELTFGFRRFDFDHFETVLIYPDQYFSTVQKRYHKGEVNLRGYIVLSWKAFVEGYADSDDGINLGIHEMAHALKLENRIVNADYNFFNPHDYSELQRLYRIKKSKVAAGEDPVLRKYAAANIHEFFAVVCENFLERPEFLFRHHRDLYRLWTRLLRQDPLHQQ